MATYSTRRPRAALYVENEHYGKAQDYTPIVDEHVPVFTGLLDAKGDEIWREPRSIGFGRRDEW